MNLYVIIGLIAGLLAYLFIGVPLLQSAVATYGILTGYPLEVLAVLALIYAFAGYLLKSRRLFVIFMLAFLVQDIVMPPIMIPMAGATTLSAGQSVAGDVFLYTAMTRIFYLPHLVGWLLTYFIVPLMLLLALAYELKTKNISELVPEVLL